MSQSQFREAIFVERRNRFLVFVEVNGKLESAHLPNSGRLGELLIPGAKALIREIFRHGRKTFYDLWGGYIPEIFGSAPTPATPMTCFSGPCTKA